jgi:hypothetical protein
VSSFRHAGVARVVAGTYWASKRRWHYEVVSEVDAEAMWLDGEERPDRLCDPAPHPRE